jgi:radical SAM protein with 4Fe4S-binding SPASM domain
MERFSGDRVHLFLSIDAADAPTMKVMRPQLDIEKLRRNLGLYRRLRDGRGAAHHARLYFQFVPTLRNIEQLPGVVEWARESGAVRVEVLNYRTEAIGEEAVDAHIRGDLDRARRAFERAQRRAAELGVPLALPLGYDKDVTPAEAEEVADLIHAPVRVNPPGSKYPLACSAPWFRINVYENGDIRPCCWYRYPMGNLFRESFETIWNGAAYRKMRRRINSRFPHLGCKTCVMTWGITAGQPDRLFEQERLLDRTHTALQRMRRRLHDRRTGAARA